MRALVTGATGFIGHHVVRRLRDHGHEIVCLVRASSRVEPLEALGASLVVGDMTDAESVQRAAADVDAVFHLAAMLKAPWRKAFHDDNVAGSAHVADACARSSRGPVLVAVSSMAAVGPVKKGPPKRETDPPAPVSRYGRVKLACDEAVAARAGDVPTTIIRPPMVFGEGDWTVLKLYRAVARGWHVVPGWRPNRVSMIHATDLAEVLIAAADRGERLPEPDTEAPAGTGVYFTAYTEQPGFDELGRIVARSIGRRSVRVLRLPTWLIGVAAGASEAVARLRDRPTFFNLDKWREARGGSWICDVSKATRDLGLDPDRDVLERFEQTGAWFRGEGYL